MCRLVYTFVNSKNIPRKLLFFSLLFFLKMKATGIFIFLSLIIGENILVFIASKL